jgi:hypothetical protein
MRLTVIASALCVLASPALGDGPSRAEFIQAIKLSGHSARPIRHLRCESIGEDEPTEFHCTFDRRNRSGAWRRWSTYVAIDGAAYQLIDDLEPVRRKAR